MYDIKKIRDEIKDIPWTEFWQFLQLPKNIDHHEVGDLNRSTPGLIGIFTEIVVKNGELERFINDYKLIKTRAIKLSPGVCYPMHKDGTTRVHLVIDTDPNCFFVEDYKLIHMPADGIPVDVDTTKMHTAFNASKDKERIHIVGCYDEVPVDKEFLRYT